MKAIESNGNAVPISDNTQTVIKYSIIVAITFSIVFILAKIFHLESNTELRFINYILLFPITYMGLKRSYNLNDHKLQYFSGFKIAFLICALGQLLYSIMFFAYLHFDRPFMTYLINEFPKQILYPQLSIAFIVLIEGISIGVIVALATMQYYKREKGRWVTTNR